MVNSLEDAGSCGRFQILHTALTQLPMVIAFWGQCLMMYGIYEPAWVCRMDTPSFPVNSSSSSLSSLSLSPWNRSAHDGGLSATSGSYHHGHHLQQYSPRPEEEGGRSLQSNHSTTTTVEEMMINATYQNACSAIDLCQRIEFVGEASTIITEFGLICDKAWIPRAMISINMLGVLLGCLYGGQVSETWGRKKGLYSSTAILTVTCGISVFSASWEMYAVLLFFLGFGAGGILATAPVYTIEFLNSWWRGAFGAIPFWNIALVTLAMLIFFLKDWRYLHVTTAALGVFSLMGAFWVPESIRWLGVQGRYEEAEEILKRIAKLNGRSLTSASEDMASIAETGKLSKGVLTLKPAKVTYLDLFRDRNTRVISIKLGAVGLIMIMCYFGMGFGISSLYGDFYINLLVGVALELPPILCIGCLINRFGRKKATAVLLAVSGIFCFISALCRFVSTGADDSTAGFASTISAFVAKSFSCASWFACVVFSVETFPTSVRNVGHGFLTMASRIGGVLAPLLMPRSNTEFVACYVGMGFAAFLSVYIVFTLKETNKKALTDIVVKRGVDEETLVVEAPIITS